MAGQDRERPGPETQRPGLHPPVPKIPEDGVRLGIILRGLFVNDTTQRLEELNRTDTRPQLWGQH